MTCTQALHRENELNSSIGTIGSIILSDLFLGQTAVAHSIHPVVSCGACQIKGTIGLPKFDF